MSSFKFPQLEPSPIMDDAEAGFESMGLDLEEDPESGSESSDPELSMEDMITTHFIDELIEKNRNSLEYQNRLKDQNTEGLKEADKVRRKLGG